MTSTPSPSTEPNFGTLLRSHRLAAGLTQEELAERTGLSVRGISDLERSLRIPRLETLRMLSSGLGFTPETSEHTAMLVARHTEVLDSAHDSARPPLPVPSTPLIGRERELAGIINLLEHEHVRFLTLVGPGGVGKSRLAQELLANAPNKFVDGAWFVPLAAVRDPLLIPDAIADAMGVQPRGHRPVMSVLADVLRHQAVLLVLDNMEHLRSEVPTWLIALLASSPGLSVVTTSRAALRLRGERRLSVEPLSIPVAGPKSRLEDNSAVQLFVQRATSIFHEFAPNEQDIEIVADICRRLDCLPLAIELAASRVSVLSLREILDRLPHRLDLLARGPRDAPAHQQSLQDTIAWSCDLLTPSEQRLFRRVAVFLGGFTLDAAGAVLSGASETWSEDRVIEGIGSLIDQSLLRRVPVSTGEARFEMLETIRQFALAQLELQQESTHAWDQQAAWCVALTRNLWPAWLTSRQQDAASQLDREHNNIRSTLGWLVERDDRRQFVQLTTSLWMYWFIRGHFAEGQRWLELALQWTEGEVSIDRVRSLMGVYALDLAQGNSAHGANLEPEMRMLWSLPEAVGVDSPAIPVALAARLRSDQSEAKRIYEAEIVNLLTLVPSQPAATGLAGVALVNLSSIVLDEGDSVRARNLARRSLTMQREAAFPWGIAEALSQLGMIAAREGNVTEASKLYADSLGYALEEGDPWQIANALGRLAVIAGRSGDAQTAALILGVAERSHELIGRELESNYSENERQTLRRARDQLGVDQFDELREQGRAQSVEEALAAVQATATTTPVPHGITQREREVLQLVAAGRTDQQIANELYISRRTAEWHVRNVLGKLGAANRAEAAVFAARHQLL